MIKLLIVLVIHWFFGVEISNASNPIIYWEKDGKLIQKNNKLSFVLSDFKPVDTELLVV